MARRLWANLAPFCEAVGFASEDRSGRAHPLLNAFADAFRDVDDHDRGHASAKPNDWNPRAPDVRYVSRRGFPRRSRRE